MEDARVGLRAAWHYGQSNRATRYSGALGAVLSTEVLWDTGVIGAFMATRWDCVMAAWWCCEQPILLGCWGWTRGHQNIGGYWSRIWGRSLFRDRSGGVSSWPAPWARRCLGTAGLDLLLAPGYRGTAGGIWGTMAIWDKGWDGRCAVVIRYWR